MDTNSAEDGWNAYLAAYGAVEAEQRADLLQQSVADDVIFTNPGGEGRTRTGLITHIEDFQRKMPGMYFGTDKLFFHRQEGLAVWSMYRSDGTKLATGYNFIRMDEDGRFSYLAGFF